MRLCSCRIGDWEDGGLWQNIFLHRWGTMNDLTKNSWDFLYEQIGKCNQSVDKLQAFAEEQPDVEYFKVYLEEVRASVRFSIMSCWICSLVFRW